MDLWVGTIDGAQGLEFDYVLLDLVIDDRVGMMELVQRVNVGATRGKLGLVILGSMVAISRASGNAEALQSLKNYFKGRGIVHKMANVQDWPRCQYLSPA